MFFIRYIDYLKIEEVSIQKESTVYTYFDKYIRIGKYIKTSEINKAKYYFDEDSEFPYIVCEDVKEGILTLYDYMIKMAKAEIIRQTELAIRLSGEQLEYLEGKKNVEV